VNVCAGFIRSQRQHVKRKEKSHRKSKKNRIDGDQIGEAKRERRAREPYPQPWFIDNEPLSSGNSFVASYMEDARRKTDRRARRARSECGNRSGNFASRLAADALA